VGNPGAFELRAMIVPLLFARYVVNMPDWLNRTSSTHHGTWLVRQKQGPFRVFSCTSSIVSLITCEPGLSVSSIRRPPDCEPDMSPLVPTSSGWPPPRYHRTPLMRNENSRPRHIGKRGVESLLEDGIVMGACDSRPQHSGGLAT